MNYRNRIPVYAYILNVFHPVYDNNEPSTQLFNANTESGCELIMRHGGDLWTFRFLF